MLRETGEMGVYASHLSYKMVFACYQVVIEIWGVSRKEIVSRITSLEFDPWPNDLAMERRFSAS